MGLPDPVALKFCVYTLACRHFTAHLSDLSTATQSGRRWTFAKCCAIFDEALHTFFDRATPTDLPDAASSLSELLRVQVNLFRRNSLAPAAVFDKVIADMVASASRWNFATDFRQMHDLGRDLARRFYTQSTNPATQERCRLEYSLEFEYGTPDEEVDPAGISVLSLGYRAAPVAFRPKSKSIVVRFNFDNDLSLYLAYPFMFLHEYSAHIYATDYGNDLFNDGWMLHAADVFLRRLWNADDALVANMSRHRATIFYDHFYGVIKRIRSVND